MSSTQLEVNKNTVLAFYEKAVNQRDVEGALQYLGPYYTQHRADVRDGSEGLREFIERSRVTAPHLHAEVKRVLADGDYVVLHSHVSRRAEELGSKHIDIFRLENGKVVEHWDIDQPIAEHAINNNGPF